MRIRSGRLTGTKTIEVKERELQADDKVMVCAWVDSSGDYFKVEEDQLDPVPEQTFFSTKVTTGKKP